MQIGDYQIIRYEHQYKNEVIGVLMSLLGPERDLNTTYLDWKHWRNPYVTDPFIYMALHKGNVVAVASHFASCWEAGQSGPRYLCTAGADAFTLVDHRRHHLHREITSAAVRDLQSDRYDFDICLGSNQFSSGSAIRLGWAKVGELKTMLWQAGQNVSQLRQIARKIPMLPTVYRFLHKGSTPRQESRAAFQPFQTLDQNYRRTSGFGGVGIVVEEKARPDAMAGLVNRRKYDGRIRHVRDEQFYTWRYQNPLSVYRFLFWEKAGFQGYLVLQQPVRAVENTAFIVDWETTDVRLFSELVQSVIRWGGFSSVGIWSVTLDDYAVTELSKLGFRELSESNAHQAVFFLRSLLVLPLNTADRGTMGGRTLLDTSNWDLRPIYSDAY